MLHTYYLDKYEFKIDGITQYSINSISTITAQNHVYLFATNTSGNVEHAGGSLKMYYCKIWNGDSLIRHFVPCTNSNGVAGLFDLMNQTFYVNQGTGTFLTGAIS